MHDPFGDLARSCPVAQTHALAVDHRGLERVEHVRATWSDGGVVPTGRIDHDSGCGGLCAVAERFGERSNQLAERGAHLGRDVGSGPDEREQ